MGIVHDAFLWHLQTEQEDNDRAWQEACQEPDVNVPLMFTKNAPRMFTKNVPGMFTENVPPMFGQNVPHMFTRMHHPAQSLPLPHPRQALSQGEEPARCRLLRRGERPAMHCCGWRFLCLF